MQKKLNIRDYSFPDRNHVEDLHNTSDSDVRSILNRLRIKNINNVIVAHLNVNAIANKIDFLRTLVPEFVDILILGETKLNSSHTTSQLFINGFREPFRRDRGTNDGGGLLIYVRDDIPCRLLKKHTFESDIEGMFIELNFRKCKWLLFGTYRSPSQDKAHYFRNLTNSLEIYVQSYDKILLAGDFNAEVNDYELNAFMSVFGLNSLNKEKTCFKSLENPSCIDLILTNCPRSFQNTMVVSTGISDFHKMVVSVFKTTFNKCEPKQIHYRSYKKFSAENFRNELKDNLSAVHQPISYDVFYKTFITTLDKHAPLKKRLVRANEVPYMTKKLRKAISTRSRLENKYQRLKTTESQNAFRKQRNYCSRLYKRERKNFYEQLDVNSYTDTRKFWELNKPFFSDKGMTHSKITLIENDRIISDCQEIAETFNTFFKNAVINLKIPSPTEHLNVSNEQDPVLVSIEKYSKHPSILKIKEIVKNGPVFTFSETTLDNILKFVGKLKTKKAGTSNDIPTKVLKDNIDICGDYLLNFINYGINTSNFDSNLKLADISPIFKDTDRTNTQKYRPVSVLPVISKVFERTLEEQITTFIDKYLSPFLCGYRKGFNTQHALLALIEKWRKILDKKGFGGAILMDLSKAFDTINHELLIAKLHAYGFDEKSLRLLHSYLSDRWQRTKVNNFFSTWAELIQGVPQGSILGPLLFNIYLNDLFYFILDTDVCNFADDTTLYTIDMELPALMNRLEIETNTCVEWFYLNYMKLNGDKCHLIVGGNKPTLISTEIQGNTILETSHERLLGVKIDRDLKFDVHLNDICKKAGNKLSALARQCKILPFYRRKLLVNAYFNSIFGYGQLTWMFCSRGLNNKINKLHLRALRIVYRDYTSSFEELLKIDGSCSIHQNNIKFLATEIYKSLNGLSPKFMSDIFTATNNNFDNISYNTRYHNDFYNESNPKTESFGISSLGYFGPKVWQMIPSEIKNASTLKIFKEKIKKWQVNNCLCRLCKKYVQRIGFL